MGFPRTRLRRLRRNRSLRGLVAETSLDPGDFIYPLFVAPGEGVREEVPAMPGVCRFSVDRVGEEAEEAFSLGVRAFLLFGIPERKDEWGSEAYADGGVVQKALRVLRERLPQAILITDVCLCEYMSHGHCGVIKDGEVENDETLELLAMTALSHARAGADLVAPSDMMDGRVGAIREALDEAGFQHVGIMSYAAKYASSFYGPFREAAQSAPSFGDRRSYQMDPPNAREALREMALDLEEGADILMVKPALAYLDVLRRARERFDVPLAAYNVSGEYSMIKAAAARGWLDERLAVLEVLTAIKRAGADLIITYFAKDAARYLRSGG